jgi:hypothetical protein
MEKQGGFAFCVSFLINEGPARVSSTFRCLTSGQVIKVRRAEFGHVESRAHFVRGDRAEVAQKLYVPEEEDGSW